MKFKALATAFIFSIAAAAPAIAALTNPVPSLMVSTYPIIGDTCQKAGQWTGFADSRYDEKLWASVKSKMDKSLEFGEQASISHFGIFVCKLTNSKLTWQHYARYPVNYKPGRVFSKTSTVVPKIFELRSAPYPGEGKKCEVQSCPLGSTGPGGGIVFYDAGKVQSWGRYLEVAPQGWSGNTNDPNDPYAFWCDKLPALPYPLISNVGKDISPQTAAATTIGMGPTLTARMLKGCVNGAASLATSYLGIGSNDWFLPSQGEINELCKFAYGQLNSPSYILCDGMGTPRLGLSGIYWSSQQLVPHVGMIGVAEYSPAKLGEVNELFSSLLANPEEQRAIRPIRAFSSPSDPLPSAGVIQLAGAGDPAWPAKCPSVVDKVGGPQPQVTSFYYDGYQRDFLRLDVNSGTPVKGPHDLIGCYADLKDLTSHIGNGYHIGSINRDARGYFWLNAQGVKFGLTLSGTTLITDKDNPYYDDGHQFILKP